MFPQFVSVFLIVTIATTTAIGSTPRTRSPYTVKDSFSVPKQWSRIGPAPEIQKIQLSIGLKQGQFEELERHLFEVSDPEHSRYGQHLSAEEVHELVKPTQNTLDHVHDWLLDNGIEQHQIDYSPAQDWIYISLPIQDVERLLDTKYFIYQHQDGSRIVRASEWSLPLHLHEHIELIQPTNSFFYKKPRALALHHKKTTMPLKSRGTSYTSTNATLEKVCDPNLITPTCLRTLYGTIEYIPQVPDKNRMGVVNYQGESNNRSDIHIFLNQFRPEAAGAAYEFPEISVAGGSVQQTPDNATQFANFVGVEGDLDVEIILGIGYPTPLTTYSVGGVSPFIPDAFVPIDTNEPFLAWVQYMLAQDSIPQVISTSYDTEEQTVPISYARKVCKLFAQLGARGVSLLFSSGNFGVGVSGTCFTNDGKNTPAFVPHFPDSCPYVTSVGATKNFNPEVVAFDPTFQEIPGIPYATGGGFSNYFPRPAYQDNVVPQYVASLSGKFDGLYNKSGRAYPDIAAQGQDYAIVWNGTVLPIGIDGTSTSTPAAAAVLVLVNDALIAAGKPVLGFLNPWLYKVGFAAFKDITSGSAVGCNTSGFPAQVGWDAVSGFGTPYFPLLKDLALFTL